MVLFTIIWLRSIIYDYAFCVDQHLGRNLFVLFIFFFWHWSFAKTCEKQKRAKNMEKGDFDQHLERPAHKSWPKYTTMRWTLENSKKKISIFLMIKDGVGGPGGDWPFFGRQHIQESMQMCTMVQEGYLVMTKCSCLLKTLNCASNQ